MFRNIIAPVQAWLLSQGQCVGCSMPLSKGSLQRKNDGTDIVTCVCGRSYIKVSEKKYRRAKVSEINT